MILASISPAQWALVVPCCAATLYIMFAALVRYGHPVRRVNTDEKPVSLRPVSVLKPLCGFESRLHANLETFCKQTHPCFELLFGVASLEDPAVAIVERLRAAHPDTDIKLVVDASLYGSNRKVSNLSNLENRARHELIVIADSDISVQPDYLVKVTGPLLTAGVGVVTCLYRARRIGNFWARLGALFIDEWFSPSVYLAHAAGSQRFGFGATLAIRRETLDAVGGLRAFRNCVADDFSIAQAVRRMGLRTYLSGMHDDEVVLRGNIQRVRNREPVRWRVEQAAARDERGGLCKPGRIPERTDFALRLIARARAAVESVI
ncbi:glycosyltransferase [Caballeronia sordidicola]|uniref:Glycosyltransferase n=1 Tax=Caballeronia sordidicola TaxID=196367 RepID=A0A158G5V3_CABSO|nr:glycosyltransferase [Caballeronia sordidicola]